MPILAMGIGITLSARTLLDSCFDLPHTDAGAKRVSWTTRTPIYAGGQEPLPAFRAYPANFEGNRLLGRPYRVKHRSEPMP